MSNEAEKHEADILRVLRSRYERRGYTFVSRPTLDLLPDFLKNYRPDAIAIAGDERIIIELKSSQNPSSDKRLAQLAKQVAAYPNWKLEVFYAGNFTRPVYDKPDINSLQQLINEVEALLSAGFTRPALIMAWAAIEAAARALGSEAQHRSGPRIPSEVIEWLAREGHIDAPTGRILRNMIKTRNAIVHGDLKAPLQGHELLILTTALRTLLEQASQSS